MANADFFDLTAASSLTDMKFFPDTNIWIFMYGNAYSGDFANKSRDYSNLIAKLEKSNNLYTSEKVISEFFNRVCKIEAEILTGSKDFSTFKTFRKTQQYQELSAQVCDWCAEILDMCNYVECSHTPTSLKSALNAASTGRLDLTDASIELRCRENNLILITDDSDYMHCDIPIVTGNQRLIKELGRARN